MRIYEITGSSDTEPTYATNPQYRQLNNQLAAALPGLHGKIEGKNASRGKAVSHLRLQKTTANAVQNAMKKAGYHEVAPDRMQSTTSDQYPALSFSDASGVLYTIVVTSRNNTSVGIAKKELSPVNLGLAGREMSRDDLIKQTTTAIQSKVPDPELQSALIGLINIAASGGKGNLPPEQAVAIRPHLALISQDFGEVLAPILVMQSDDVAEFPSGNNPIVDVKVAGMNISVKALTGSGTSFSTIQDLMDKYEQSVSDESKLQRYHILKQFHPSTGGKNTDKIIRAVAQANIPEYQTLCSILGVSQIGTYSELVQAISKITSSDYGTFLRTVYPAMTAGNWGKPMGLPADGAFYMGASTKKPSRERTAGKVSYTTDPAKAAADIMTYSLGKGLETYIKSGEHADEYSSMMTDIVKQADAVIGHITVNPDGSLKLITRPFSDLNFMFQYHAPSHIPGNNLPGFIAILD